MGRLSNKVAFITGVGRGQGRAHAVAMAREGATIVGLDVCGADESWATYPATTPADLEETADQVRSCGVAEPMLRQGDVRERADIARLLAETKERFGRLDIVVANAGNSPFFGEVADTMQAFHDAVDVCLAGAFNTVDLAAPHMIEANNGGSIIFTSSAVGLRSLPGGTLEAVKKGWVGYIAAKHGVVGLMRHYATALARYSIRCNSLHPTGVNTLMTQNEAMSSLIATYPDLQEALGNAMPVTVIEPEDVAAAAVWLASDDARYVTGVTLPVDAGYLIR